MVAPWLAGWLMCTDMMCIGDVLIGVNGSSVLYDTPERARQRVRRATLLPTAPSRAPHTLPPPSFGTTVSPMLHCTCCVPRCLSLVSSMSTREGHCWQSSMRRPRVALLLGQLQLEGQGRVPGLLGLVHGTGGDTRQRTHTWEAWAVAMHTTLPSSRSTPCWTLLSSESCTGSTQRSDHAASGPPSRATTRTATCPRPSAGTAAHLWAPCAVRTATRTSVCVCVGVRVCGCSH